ncbi:MULTISPECIES: outer membrane lipoprotein carrier protein LolA [Bacillaceae]|uniref:LolA family protein n=1 Tax=Bacillaceae TaxID=186817 RepID=UPI001E35485C|nr:MULTISPECIES: outer membrane lipoprotein carrier protein LolA [Bacillaceae]MCE4050686.1 outer membrane lipoprotein carrier protein LolA [Bacillus sp. Au-Bac7]MCM3031914.1 outer membrane lipoprotein carrier protein LolA [Niallia sp. MER 6]MDL0436081.1 outer membrane lipoprotein carrier protein LolA [Niallia sp. SS-2023]UPO87939.1 outer membrane lipoprotein carrier protein LolA [Niallia sp. Man26]
MNKKLWLLFVGLAVMVMLTACGTKSKEDVLKDLDEKVATKGYKADAEMTLQMGTEPQTYDVQIWHKDPTYYRVNLKNAKKDQSQMILRNDEGVYVLTPALNKSFKFQSDWPENSSQAYLYESLVKDIEEDKDAKFSSTDKYYVFETKTRYQNNKMLPTQEITLNKKDLSPVSVKVKDTDGKALVTVKFSNVKFDVNFDKADFDLQKSMTAAKLAVPVMAEVDEDESFSVKYPETLLGASLVEEKKVATEDGERVVLTYDGQKSYTIIQEKAEVAPATAGPINMTGNPVDLGFAIGAVSGNKISWTYEGVDYVIASTELSEDEMAEIARSVQGEAIK